MDFLSNSLYCVIVSNGLGSKIIKVAKDNGIKGATVILAKGTISSGFLNFLGLNDYRREFVMMAAPDEIGDKALLKLVETFSLTKPNHGIAFTISLKQIFNANLFSQSINDNEENLMNKDKYNLIITIVDNSFLYCCSSCFVKA